MLTEKEDGRRALKAKIIAHLMVLKPTIQSAFHMDFSGRKQTTCHHLCKKCFLPFIRKLNVEVFQKCVVLKV